MSYGMQRYARVMETAFNPRDVEIMALTQVIQLLKSADNEKARLHALSLNQKLWSAILRETGVENNNFPEILRGDLRKLAVWSTRYSINAMLKAISLKPLIDVNQDLLDGLRGQNAAPDAVLPSTAAANNIRTSVSA